MPDSSPDMTFDFSLTEDQDAAGAHVIAVAGEVDIFTAPELKRAIAAAIDAGARRLVVDLTETRFLDSTALGVLIGAVKRLRPLGRAARDRQHRAEHRQDVRDHRAGPDLHHRRRPRRGAQVGHRRLDREPARGRPGPPAPVAARAAG